MKTVELNIPKTASERRAREAIGIYGLISRMEARASDGRYYALEDEDREKAVAFLKSLRETVKIAAVAIAELPANSITDGEIKRVAGERCAIHDE